MISLPGFRAGCALKEAARGGGTFRPPPPRFQHCPWKYPRQRRKEEKSGEWHNFADHEAMALPNARSKCRRVNCCNSGPAGSQSRGRRTARQDQAAWEDPPARRSEPPAGPGERARAAAARRGQLRELTWNFPGTRRPHLTEHLQVVLVLVQIQHLGLQQGGGADAAGEGDVTPRAVPAGAPSREAPGARLRRPALALHPQSASRSGRGRQPGSPELAHWLPRILRLPGRPRSSPTSAAQTRNCWSERPAWARPHLAWGLPEAKGWDSGALARVGPGTRPPEGRQWDLAAGYPARASTGAGVWAEATERAANFRGSTAGLESSRPISPRVKTITVFPVV